jgi:MoaA/NifB/PqqE/SkfB family radical SAM enzyme
VGQVPVRLKRAGRKVQRSLQHPGPDTACYAPSVQLYFQPDGEVRACCRNMKFPLGNITHDRLRDVWDGGRRAELIEALAADDYSKGCDGCEWEIRTEGRAGSYPEDFAVWGPKLGRKADITWPRRMEFNLSNVCNLQCIQCNGDLSSSIRIHREGRLPLPNPYGDEFLEDLRDFLPHLEVAQFAGGEPFMAPVNFRVWELMAEVAPHVRCTVVTNATQWNKRVEQALETIPLSFTFSIDGMSEQTYESIRVGSDFGQVLTNIDRFCAYAEDRGTRTEINFCLMAQNHHEFGDLLLFAEQRGIPVNVSVVHYPEACAIARRPPDEVLRILEHLDAQAPTIVPQLSLNRGTWEVEVERIRAWAAGQAADTDHALLWAGTGSIAGFSCDGRGATDDDEARAELEALSVDGVVHQIDVGLGDRVVKCSPSVADLVGHDVETITRLNLSDLQGLLVQRFGDTKAPAIVLSGEDRVDALTEYGDRHFRSAMVPLRDGGGKANVVRLLITAVEPEVLPTT